MASYFEDTSQWRLSTAGGLKYKFLGIDGHVEEEDANISWRALIQSSDLISFMQELFPPPLIIGNFRLPRAATLPGLPTMVAKKIRFRSQDAGMPIDPFNADSTAPDGTYYPVVEVTVQFGPGPKNNASQDDPFTFLEISADATGEFIHAPTPKAKWDHKEGTETIDDDTGEVTEDQSTTSTDEVRDATVPTIINVPQTDWTLRWPQIDFDFFHDIMIHRLRILMGRVNSNTVPVLFNAHPETLLFMGYSLRQQYTWREDDQTIGRPPVVVEMKIREKRVVWRGSIRGHNDVWRPGFGWDRLLVDGTNPSYADIDYGILFRV